MSRYAYITHIAKACSSGLANMVIKVWNNHKGLSQCIRDHSAAKVVIFTRTLSLEPTSAQCAVTIHSKSESDPDITDL